MTARLDISLFSALCLLLAVTFCSCSQIYEDGGSCGQEQKPGNRISLKFKIHTESASTPTRGLGQWEEQSANAAERILNPRDVRVLLLNADQHLVRSFKPNVLEYVEEGGITGDGYYELSVFFEDDNLDRLEDHEELTFSVMIMANINSVGGNYTTDDLIYGAARDKLQELFTMPADWFPSQTQGIPMYGYRTGIRATKAQLADENYSMGDITMLRAMCKIEVTDNIVGAAVASDGNRYPRVTGVELVSWRDKGYLRPRYDGYEGGGLRTAYIPTSSTVVTTPVNAAYITDENDKDKGRFRIYCPEARLEDIKIRVATKMGPDEETKYYEESLGQYADDGKVFGTDLVRNHIYRFSVNSLSAVADLTVTVLPWTTKTDEYTLDDIIMVDEDGYLQWTNIAENNNFSVSKEIYNGKEEQQLSILRGTTDYATGKFNIKSPKGAVWRACFIPGENGVDAFEFVDVDAAGNVTAARPYAEGNVGEQATIHIRGKGPADAYRHTAELVVEVRQADGTVLYAPLTEGSSRFIIYRENKL